jgi:hypothetical protein
MYATPKTSIKWVVTEEPDKNMGFLTSPDTFVSDPIPADPLDAPEYLMAAYARAYQTLPSNIRAYVDGRMKLLEKTHVFDYITECGRCDIYRFADDMKLPPDRKWALLLAASENWCLSLRFE